jgi:hypothetical protein
MISPTLCEILSDGDEYDRARQRDAFQLQNELTAAGRKCPILFEQWVNTLGTLLMATGARLKGWKIPSSSQVLGKARG